MNATIKLKMIAAMLEAMDVEDEEAAEEAIEMMKTVLKQGPKDAK